MKTNNLALADLVPRPPSSRLGEPRCVGSKLQAAHYWRISGSVRLVAVSTRKIDIDCTDVFFEAQRSCRRFDIALLCRTSHYAHMAAEFIYITNPAKIRPFLDKIRAAGKPEKVTLKTIESLGFKSNNDRALLPDRKSTR